MKYTNHLWASLTYGQLLLQCCCVKIWSALPVLCFHVLSNVDVESCWNCRLIEEIHQNIAFSGGNYFRLMHQFPKCWEKWLGAARVVWLKSTLTNGTTMQPVSKSWECINLYNSEYNPVFQMISLKSDIHHRRNTGCCYLQNALISFTTDMDMDGHIQFSPH